MEHPESLGGDTIKPEQLSSCLQRGAGDADGALWAWAICGETPMRALWVRGRRVNTGFRDELLKSGI